MHRLITRARSTAVSLMVIFVVGLSQTAQARAITGDGGSGGCNVFVNPTCTVGVGDGGGSGGGGGGGGTSGGGDVHGCQNTDPAGGGCDPCPAGAVSGDLGLSAVCAAYLHNQVCYVVKVDTLGGLVGGAGNDIAGAVDLLTIAQVAALNRTLSSFGCAAVVTPATLAEQAYSTIVFPRPSGHRSPSETLLYKGFAFTYVNLWLYFWTSPATWHTLTATASAGGVSATVTARPTELVYDPGDGSPAVSCAGPGRAWTDADGNDPPGGGACGYQYGQVTGAPITAIQTIVWSISWTGTGNTGGEIPSLSTATSGRLNVMQIETVVTR